MSEMKLIMESWRSFVNEASVNHVNSEDVHQKTGQVDFEWGEYVGRHKDELYYSSEGKLGSIQRNGDPYTYEPVDSKKLKVISAPESGKSSIGAIIEKEELDKEKEKEKPLEEDPKFNSYIVEITDAIRDLTLYEFYNDTKLWTIAEEFDRVGGYNDFAFWTGIVAKRRPTQNWSVENWKKYIMEAYAMVGSDSSAMFGFQKGINPMKMTISSLISNNPYKLYSPTHNPALQQMALKVQANKDETVYTNTKYEKKVGTIWNQAWPWYQNGEGADLIGDYNNAKKWLDDFLKPEYMFGIDIIENALFRGVLPGGVALDRKKALDITLALLYPDE